MNDARNTMMIRLETIGITIGYLFILAFCLAFWFGVYEIIRVIITYA